MAITRGIGVEGDHTKLGDISTVAISGSHAKPCVLGAAATHNIELCCRWTAAAPTESGRIVVAHALPHPAKTDFDRREAVALVEQQNCRVHRRSVDCRSDRAYRGRS